MTTQHTTQHTIQHTTQQYIISCECHDTPQFAVSAYNTLVRSGKIAPSSHSSTPSSSTLSSSTPPVIHKDKELDTLANKGKNIGEFIRALQRAEKFAFYFEYDESSDTLSNRWNLMTGRRVQ